MLIRVDQLAKRIGGRTLFGDVSFEVRPRDRIGVVGPNGAGKSTLLKCIFGTETPDDGRVSVPRSVSVGMLRQEIDPRATRTVRDEAATALAHLDALESEMRALEERMTDAGDKGHDVPEELAERYHEVTARFEWGGGFERHARVDAVLSGLGFDEEARARPLSTFSGGWLMRVELAKLLLSDPDVLLLDEPTNHLDLPAIQWFEETLESFPGAVLTVSHDRTFLRRHVSRVAELDGLGGFTPYEGNYDSYLAQRAERRATLLAAKEKQDREVAQMERFVERFRAKATKAKQAQSRIKALERMERIAIEPENKRRIRLRIPPPPRSGSTVMTLDDATKSYGDKTVYQGMDFQLQRGETVALAGPNGAGKSTLLRLVAGVLDLDAGTRAPGHNVQIGFYAQHQLESLDPGNTVLEELGTVAQLGDGARLRGHLGAFLFSGDDVEKKVSVLSGGEKARLALAKMLFYPANLLVLDEPTNHLDIEACEVLEQALDDYPGTLVFVSHDRSFINALASRVVEVKAGELRSFPGDYDDYLRKTSELDAPKAPAATTPSPAAEAAAPSAPPSQKPKQTKEQRQRERERRKSRDKITRQVSRLEEEIQSAEGELEQLGWKLGEPDLYKDVDRMRELTESRERIEADVAEKYAEWERLSDELAALDDLQAD